MGYYKDQLKEFYDYKEKGQSIDKLASRNELNKFDDYLDYISTHIGEDKQSYSKISIYKINFNMALQNNKFESGVDKDEIIYRLNLIDAYLQGRQHAREIDALNYQTQMWFISVIIFPLLIVILSKFLTILESIIIYIILGIVAYFILTNTMPKPLNYIDD